MHGIEAHHYYKHNPLLHWVGHTQVGVPTHLPTKEETPVLTRGFTLCPSVRRSQNEEEQGLV